jgi:hypothetical protein
MSKRRYSSSNVYNLLGRSGKDLLDFIRRAARVFSTLFRERDLWCISWLFYLLQGIKLSKLSGPVPLRAKKNAPLAKVRFFNAEL